MSTTFAGHYPIEHREGEIERLEAQGITFAPDARIMLDRIGVAPGWTCLDLGCGPRGITDLMSERVGPNGRVIGVDRDEKSLAYATAHAAAQCRVPARRCLRVRLAGRDIRSRPHALCRQHSRRSGTPAREAIRLARPGGVVALQEPDAEPMPAIRRIRPSTS